MNLKKNDLNKLILPLIKRLEKAEKFSLEQAPDICKEIIKENVLSGAFLGTPLLLIGLLGVIGAILLANHLVLMEIRDAQVAYLFVIFPMAALFFGYNQLLSAYIASKTPKLTILKELSKLVNKGD